MKPDTRATYVTRDAILKLLSDDEMARVSNAETAAHLVEGDEYIDLEAPARGVRETGGTSNARMGQVLPRKAVMEKTWQKVVALLPTHPETTRVD